MGKVLEESVESGETIDAKNLFGKFALDGIATAGFGIESNSFQDPNNAFRQNALKLVK